MRLFFRGLRLALMPFMLLWARLGMPKGIVRSTEAQRQVDLECGKLALYHFKTCPFCIKVRHEMGRLSLPIELRDAQHDPEHRAALLQGGGKIQTPCLRIADAQGQVQWMYESDDIIGYLRRHYA
ncbi:MAG TPA: glutathione S-transferase N-terminal domain-containing protein [Sideroxyarcus sp.]|nr:glutathione S-transferase N-terminal domain-containing protein [Sideroxyarcus sp.]